MLCATRAAPKRSAVAFTGGAAHIITPHALPMFQADNRDHKKARRAALDAQPAGTAAAVVSAVVTAASALRSAPARPEAGTAIATRT